MFVREVYGEKGGGEATNCTLGYKLFVTGGLEARGHTRRLGSKQSPAGSGTRSMAHDLILSQACTLSYLHNGRIEDSKGAG